jgi:hypothetical protein
LEEVQGALELHVRIDLEKSRVRSGHHYCKTAHRSFDWSNLARGKAGITASVAIRPFATIVGFLVAPTFIVMMACIYSTAPNKRMFLGLIGLKN